jgi:Carboxypeptidase regulatory-like domain/TonB-dependent Receptor Plug Domain/TonB dependent receptor
VRVRFPRIAFLFACAVSLALPLAAQSTNGTVNGRVLDPSNKVIGGADILVINDATGVQYSGKTNQDGIYVVPNLPPGAYRLQVSKVGFKTLIKPDIVLNIQGALAINFTLPVGAVFETVTVEGGASMINTTDASVSTVVDQTYVKNMPLNGRSFQDLILLTPGVLTNSPQVSSGIGASGEFSVNGQRTESNNYTVDGVSGNIGASSAATMIAFAGASGSVPASTALGTTQALVSVDDLQEFRVQSSTYSAEYGRNPGGQFAFETKSGTNQWHGTAYDYLRNGVLDAPNWFNDYFGLSEPELRQNDFGGTFGGPAEVPGLYNGRDKTFFFVSYEGLRLAAPQAANASFVPDTALRASAPRALQQVLNAFPVQSPNGIDDTLNGIAQFISSWSTPASLNSTSSRFDHNINDRLRLFFRFSDTNSSSSALGSVQRLLTPATDQLSRYIMRTYTAGANSVFSSHGSNELRFNFSSNGVTSTLSTDSIGGSVPVSLSQLTGLGPKGQVAVTLLYGGYETQLVQSGQSSVQRQWNLVDTVSFSLGRHQFKCGLDYRRLEPVAIQPTPLEAYDYQSIAQVQTNSLTTRFKATGPAYPLYTNFSAFAQDEWRISERLSFSLGLRWEINPAPGVTQGLKPYTIDFVSPDPNTWNLASQGTPLWRTTWFNFAPRLGAAYILHDASGWETVVRGGGGVFFDTGQQLGSLGFLGPGYSTGVVAVPSASFPTPLVPLPIVNPPVAPYSEVNGFSTHLQLPYTLQWNASIEQALGKSQALNISYVGAHGSRLLQSNLILPSNNPNAFAFTLNENGLTSDYDALQIQFRRRLSRGLIALASYTWSHCLDYGSENYNFGYQRGNCDFDVRHNFSTAFSYDLPNVGHDRFVGAVLDRWGLDDRFTARTAFPVTLAGFGLVEPDGQFYDEGLNIVSGQPIYLYGASCASVLQGLGDLQPGQTCPGGRAINPNAFVNVNSGLGDAPRNFARGFGAWQMDFAVRRDFPIHERLKLQFRAEAFNVFNHPNFGTVNGQSGTATFGQATATLANSLGVLSPLYEMGGPRSMQFALKVIF